MSCPIPNEKVSEAQTKDAKHEIVTEGMKSRPSTTDGSTMRGSSEGTSLSSAPTMITPTTVPSDPKFRNKLRHKYASFYRRLFGVIFTANLAVFIVFIIEAQGTPEARTVANAASANLMICLLFRQEEFVNALYEIFTCVPHSWPLALRERFAYVFHYGGVHSGAGTSAVVWYLLYTSLLTKEYIRGVQDRDAMISLATSWILVCMFTIILTSAHPSIRRKFHDHFEAFHRFAGWVSLITFWIGNIFSAMVNARELHQSLGQTLVTSPNFWFICVTTSCTILSWSRLRRRTVYPEKLSDHATRLHFKYRGMEPFYGLKLSDRPLTEWHAFATIPDYDPESGKINGFSVVVSNAGDWTKKQIMASEERKLWVRGAPLHGLLYTSRLFKRIVVVATGSGIGPCLSLMAANETPRRILWSTREPIKTYGENVTNAVLRADPVANIWNTTEKGYPDIVLETHRLVLESDAEAVFIISNPKVTDKVVFGMRLRGIAAYGAIFDS